MNLPSSEVFYLPHHAVLKESSTTTKLRVVFDASRKSSTGVSLKKMFRQIQLAPNQRDFQRIVWRFDSNGPIKEYRIATVIDGTAAAPFLATRTLRQVADDVKEEFPTAAKVIKEDFYMDDVSSGSFSVESTIQLRRDLAQSMDRCGFRLRKWLSNSQDVLESIPVEDRADSSDLVEIMEESVKTLGVFWNPKSDCFEFKISSFSSSEQLTKRQLLSEISKLFDPIGWLSPVTIVAKTFMQSLWSLKEIGWDDKIPDEKLKFWESYRSQLKSLERIKIPRWIGTKQVYEVQLHGFGDASVSAYAAGINCGGMAQNGLRTTDLIFQGNPKNTLPIWREEERRQAALEINHIRDDKLDEYLMKRDLSLNKHISLRYMVVLR
ncbi:uncharacterized protein LOC119083940 [Bradysia coprophila]|uniref:uncharacterized protein LOC119083940 n=1 Tax=Bradysia coprophila TaxID=38358 RepID=UPI00187D86C7|nr:uncharacterized protein LOC119083940 [Bradysia coprophila]